MSQHKVRTRKTAATPSTSKNRLRSKKDSPENMDSMVKEAAYFKFLNKGGGHGHHQSDWFEAEEEIKQQYQLQ